MLVELVTNNHALRASAINKDVFDNCVNELKRWASHDGWVVENSDLIRVAPMAENITGLRDKLIEDLAASGLDDNKDIRSSIEDSSKAFVAQDYNGSITNSRIVLETVARHAAIQIAKKRGEKYSEDSWGKALHFLRLRNVIDQEEEKILAQVYSFISDAAHVPKGILAEEWARLARTFALSATYFLLRKFIAATV
jgi:hypothetical protein